MKRLLLLLSSLFILSIAVPTVCQAVGKEIQKCFRIVDENGDPVVGAQVCVVGKIQGAVADVDGLICISAEPSDKIIISCIGYNSETKTFSEIQSTQSIILFPDM